MNNNFIEKMSANTEYIDFVKAIKYKIQVAKSKVALSVNRQLITLYYEIGEEMAADLHHIKTGLYAT